MSRAETQSFGLYIHWPFCASKCPYCDFNSHVAQSIDHDRWARAYAKDLQSFAALTRDRRVTSIFFGGGTPSLMEVGVVQDILDTIASYWPIEDDCEITLEANPTSVESQKFKGFRAAGVNRISMGVQSFDADDLAFLGRNHDSSQAIKAIETAAQIFDRYSFDLIYARPNQSVEKWEEELEKALTLTRGHLSLYQLTIEEGTPFYMHHARGEFKIPDDHLAADLYDCTQAMMNDFGMPAYEVSNHARAGDESRHNLTYWRYDDYGGIGPGAHGRITLDGVKYATRGHRAPDIWLERVEQAGHGGHEWDPITPKDRFLECIMMGLRLSEGVSFAKLSDALGAPWDSMIKGDKITALYEEELLIPSPTHLQVSDQGRKTLNSVLRFLL